MAKSSQNCYSCRHFQTCSARKKGPDYWCDSYQEDAMVRMLAFQGGDNSSKSKKSIILSQGDLIAPSSNLSIAEFDESTFDVKAIMEEALKSNSLVTADLKIPEENDFPLAENFLDFAISEDYLNVKPFVRQVEIAIKLFAEWCPRCTDHDYFMNGGLQVDDSLRKFKKKVALLVHGVCPHCGARKSDLVAQEELNLYEEMAVCVGQRGGKSALTAMMYAYIVHRVIKMQRMVEIYDLLKNTTLVITFTAMTIGQVKIALWDPFFGYISESPWFKAYHKMLDDYKHRTGEELYKLKDTFLLYRHRKLLCMMNTPDTNKMRGATRLAASIDEIGRFDNSANNSKVKMNAAGVYEALERSLRTVRSAARRLLERGVDNVLPGYFLNISSPSSYRDKISTLVRESVGSTKILGIQLPTWEFNPTITKDDLSEEFRRDPVGAMCDYGAQPPLTANPFISSEAAVIKNFSGKKNPIKIQYGRTKRKDGTSTLYAYPTKLQKCGRPSALAIDAGYSNNSFALVGGSKDRETGLPRLDLFVEVMARPGIPINHTKIYKELMQEIIDERNAVIVGADQWQSIKILSDIEDEFEIKTVKYSLKYQDLIMMKEYILDNEISYPSPSWTMDEILKHDSKDYPLIFKNNPLEHFILQCLTVQDTGTQVIKGENLTDDLWRAAALCVKLLTDEDNQELFDQDDKVVKTESPTLGMVKTLSGVSGNANGGTLNRGDGMLIGISKRRG